MSSSAISVIVCSHNGARTLAATLRRLRPQVAEPLGDELIVVDDGSTDGTGEIAAKEGARVIRLAPNAGLAGARNAGVSEARASIVAFTDDDCEPGPTWVATLREAFRDPAVDAIAGWVEPGPGDNFVQRYLRAHNPLVALPVRLLKSNRLGYRLGLYVRGILRGGDELRTGSELYSVVGANMAFRRDLIIRADGFDEAFRFGGEEEDLCRRLHARPQGARIRYRADAVVVHRFEPALADALRRSRAYGRGNARAALKHPDSRLIVYPFPVAVGFGVLLGMGRRRGRLITASSLAPLALYPGWARRAISERSAEVLAYPYLQLVQECLTMVGEVEGRRAGYHSVPSHHLQENPVAVDG